jgi:biopolymer transport protein ExbD
LTGEEFKPKKNVPNMSLRKNKLRDEHSEVDTGPLNDILFILLMFFLMISTLANPNVIKMSVPRSRSDTKQKQSVVVSVDNDKILYVGSKLIPHESLESVLRNYMQDGDSIKPAVVINADSIAQWGEIVNVMKVARKLGATTSATVTGNE